MTTIEFYFDPGCPWCWNASRWLKEVQKIENLEIKWMPFSIFIKNGNGMSKDYAEKFEKSRDMLRIIQAVENKYGDKLTDALYTEFGIKVHNKKDYSDKAIDEIVKKVCSIDYEEIIKSKDNASLDDDIRRSMDSAYEVVGKEVGVPIIVFDGKTKRGYFGPVLSVAPKGEEAIKVWQGIKNLAEYDHFFELKRTRDEDPQAAKADEPKDLPKVC